jgi:F0F1-type ATP synthase assembly protein I
MRKVVLTFGFLSGGLSALMMFGTLPFLETIGYDRGLIVGYTAIVISLLFVYFGIRSYRDNVLGGRISFARGLGVGLLITLISCAFYVAAWQIISRNFMPDWMDKFNAQVLKELKASGATEAEVQAAVQKGEEFKVLLANPLVNIAFTLIEPLPVGLLITFISAAVLRRKEPRTT